MPDANFQFPRGFLWGTATSSHQVEGGNDNNQWAAWERAGKIDNGDVSGQAADWWGGRWQEDFDRAAESGQNTHRFSIEWSRVQPEPNRWDEDALAFYLDMARGAVERGLYPMVTLHHFTNPLWFEERGGWEHEGAAALFEAYVRRVVGVLKEHVNLWCTINEPSVDAIVCYLIGYFPPQATSLTRAFKVAHNLVRGHAAAYHAIHELQPEARVGLAHHYRGIRPASGAPWDRAMARLQSHFFNALFPEAVSSGKVSLLHLGARVPEAAGTQDYFGLNYYTEEEVALAWKPAEVFSSRRYPEGAEDSPNGFLANVPGGFFRAMNWAHAFGLPMIITENGTEDAGDEFRQRYLIQHVHQLWRAVNFNYPIKGYFHWSLVDNFEWQSGWDLRFGLWALDREMQARSKRPSAELYAEICQANGLSSEMVRSYTPEIFEKMFPG